MNCIKLFRLATFVFLTCVFSVTVQAELVVDSGTPDETNNRSVFYSNANFNQFVAQEFSLGVDTIATEIEVYLGGTANGDDYHIFLTTAIGVDATAADVVVDFFVPPPGTAPSLGVWTGLLQGDLSLSADTYYLVFATDVVADGGGFLPINAPNDIGQSFLSSGLETDFDVAYASDFSPAVDTVFGVRVTAVPEPGTAVLLTCCGLALAMRRKKSVA